MVESYNRPQASVDDFTNFDSFTQALFTHLGAATHLDEAFHTHDSKPQMNLDQ